MSARTRRVLLLTATLPGIALPFLPFAWNVAPVGVFSEFCRNPGLALFVVAGEAICAFAPLVLALCDSWRLLWKTNEARVFGPVAMVLALSSAPQAAGLVVYLITAEWRHAEASSLVGTGGYAAIVMLVLFARRRRIAVAGIIEIAVMGLYIAALALFLLSFWEGREAGAYLGIYTAAVFVVRIVDVLLHGQQETWK